MEERPATPEKQAEKQEHVTGVPIPPEEGWSAETLPLTENKPRGSSRTAHTRSHTHQSEPLGGSQES